MIERRLAARSFVCQLKMKCSVSLSLSLIGCAGSVGTRTASGPGDTGQRSGLRDELSWHATSPAARLGLCRSGPVKRGRDRRHQKVASRHPARHCRVHPAGTPPPPLLASLLFYCLHPDLRKSPIMSLLFCFLHLPKLTCITLSCGSGKI